MPEIPLHPKAKRLEKSFIQKSLEISANPDIIALSLGKPDESLLSLLKEHNLPANILCPQNLQYMPPPSELKKHIVKLMKKRGVNCKEEEIFLTSGAQQAMTILTTLMADNQDTILVDQLTYPGFIQVNQSNDTHLVPVPSCIQSGILIEELEHTLNSHIQPRFMYTIPEGHNPLGLSLEEKKRIQLTDLARKYQVPIVEDDAYGFLTYDQVSPPLKSFWKEGVYYIGSFSKIMGPSLRVGWIVAPGDIIEKLEILKEGLDINTSTFSQKILLSILDNLDFDAHIDHLRKRYKKKRDVMVDALRAHIPELEFEVPRSGYFIWGKFPSIVHTTELFNISLKEKNLSFLPGEAFLIGRRNDIKNCLRLSYSYCPIDMIEEGVKRLAQALKMLKETKEAPPLHNYQ